MLRNSHSTVISVTPPSTHTHAHTHQWYEEGVERGGAGVGRIVAGVTPTTLPILGKKNRKKEKGEGKGEGKEGEGKKQETETGVGVDVGTDVDKQTKEEEQVGTKKKGEGGSPTGTGPFKLPRINKVGVEPISLTTPTTEMSDVVKFQQ